MTSPQTISGAATVAKRSGRLSKAPLSGAWGWNPVALLRARLARWWQARMPLADSVTLTQRNVYILPTGAGLMLGATLLVLLVASINYQLNLGYLLTFLLAGCSVVAMHVSHGNLRGLTMTASSPEPVFAGDTALVSVTLQNPRSRPRYGVALAVSDAAQWVLTDVGAQASARVQLTWPALQRGLHRVPTLTARTLFPLGTFRVWTLWRPAAEVLVYPQPEAQPPPLPVGAADAGQGQQVSRTARPGEPDGLRAYRRGDALKNILWKKVAKTGELVSRDSVGLQQQALWLERQHTNLSHPEQQLSRLCAWVLLADQLGMRYGLRISGQELPPDNSPAHLQRCLRALALA